MSSIIAWPTGTLAVIAPLAGCRWAWRRAGRHGLFAAGFGVPVSALIPATVILVIVAAVLLAANAVAL